MLIAIKPVADAANRFNLFAGLSQLFSQAEHLHVNSSRRYKIIISTDCINSLLAGKDPVSLLSKELKNAKFGRCEVYGAAGGFDFITSRINNQVINFEHIT